MSDTKINMKLTLEVTGSEGFRATQEYTGTSMDTVRRLQNKLLAAGIELNNEDMKGA